MAPISTRYVGALPSTSTGFLKGQAPAELPIERPSTYKLMVNIRIGRRAPYHCPGPSAETADEVIE